MHVRDPKEVANLLLDGSYYIWKHECVTEDHLDDGLRWWGRRTVRQELCGTHVVVVKSWTVVGIQYDEPVLIELSHLLGMRGVKTSAASCKIIL